jgi:outer membrane murein-binding lipoprotein Lpp
VLLGHSLVEIYEGLLTVVILGGKYLMTCTSYRELSSTFARLCHLIDEATNDMDAEIKTLDKEIKQLEEAANSAKVLRNKANYIT